MSPAEVFRRRMQEARKARRLSQRGLTARLAEIGLNMNQAAITRIENGERKVSLDEAIAIAAALDVAPVHMFLPIDGWLDHEGTPVNLAPALEVDQLKARAWASGHKPLDPASFEFYLEQGPLDAMVSPEELSPEQRERHAALYLHRLRSLGRLQED